MFEYLMPLLVMRNYPGTLLDQTYRTVVTQADRVWAGTRRAVGNFRIGVQRARSATQLPVWAVRCSGTGFETWTDRRSGRCSLRDDAWLRRLIPTRRWRICAGCSKDGALVLMVFTNRSITQRERLPQDQKRRPDSRVHDSPPGNESGRARTMLLSEWSHGATLPLRSRWFRPPNCSCRNEFPSACQLRIRVPKRS